MNAQITRQQTTPITKPNQIAIQIDSQYSTVRYDGEFNVE